MPLRVPKPDPPALAAMAAQARREPGGPVGGEKAVPMSGDSSATTEPPPPGLAAGSPEAARTRALDLTVLAAFVVVYAAGAQVLDIQSWARQWWVDGAWTIAALASEL